MTQIRITDQLNSIYTVLHINRQVLFGTENQGDHQNFEKFLLPYKFGLVFIGKQKNVFFEKRIQNGQLKKTSCANSQYFFMKIPWIGPWISPID